MPIHMAEERKRELVQTENVTLNGEPAKIAGYKLDFANVRQLDGPIVAEFAWQTVERIVNNGGNFRA